MTQDTQWCLPMKATPGNAPIVLPEPGHEREVATWIHAARTDLYARILDTVIGQPGVRHKALLPLVEGHSRNLLTKALHKLMADDVISQRGFTDENAGYEITEFGVVVRDALVEYRLLDRLNQAVA